MGFKYSVSSVMTPDMNLEEVAECLQKLGYDGVEWRVHTIPSKSTTKLDYWCGNKSTVDFARIKTVAPKVRTLSRKHKLSVASLGTYLSSKLIDDVAQAMEAAKVLKCPQIRVGVPHYDGTRNFNDLFEEAVDGYLKVEALAKSYGIKALIELCSGTICPSASMGYRFVSNFDPDNVGVIYDPGNLICEGYENWQMGMELLGPYLAHVHVKNIAWEVVSQEEDGTKIWGNKKVPLAEGIVNWFNVLSSLHLNGYDGWLSIEDFSPGDTREKLASNITYLRSLEARLDSTS